MLKSMLLTGGVAALVASLAAAPALAQNTGYGTYDRDTGSHRAGTSGPDHSTPAEHAQTEQLNAAGRDGVYASPATLNGEQPGGLARAAATDAERSQDYQRQKSRYRRGVERYQAQQQDYQAAKAGYRAAMARYDRAQWRFDHYPHEVSYRYGSSALRPVSFVRFPERKLIHAAVQGPNGWVGKVRGIESRDGHARRIQIALNEQFAVWVGARHLRYDPASGVLLTDLTRDDLWGRPGVYVHTVDYDGYE